MKLFFALFISILYLTANSQTNVDFYPSKTNKLIDKKQKVVINPKSAQHFLTRDLPDFLPAVNVEIKNITNAEQMEEIAKKLLLLKDLEVLTINNCDLLFVYLEFSNLTKLKRIAVINNNDFANNDLVLSLRNNKLLEELTLSGNEETNIPDSIFVLNNLKKFTILNEDIKNKKTNTYTSTLTYSVNTGDVHSISFTQIGFNEPLSNELISTQASPTNLAFNNKIINPVISGININDSIYYLSSSIDNYVEYQSGSTLYFPKNSFLTKEGTEYKGPVKAFYREFRNPLEQVLSGIPMTNQENGQENIFVSAGMYELWAYSENNEQLTLKPDKKITINFVPTSDTGIYKFYSLDTSTGNWASSQKNIDLTKAFNQTAFNSTDFNKFIKLRDEYLRSAPDYTKFEDRFDNPSYIGKFHVKNYNFKKDSNKYNIKDFASHKKYKNYIRSKYKFYSVKFTKQGDLLFRYKTKSGQDFGYGQSIRMLDGRQLKYAGTLSKEDFKKLYYKKNISDVRLEDKGSFLLLYIKTRQGILELPLNIVEYNEKTKEYDQKTKLERNIARHFSHRVKTDTRIYNKKNKRGSNMRQYDRIKGVEKKLADKLAYDKIHDELNEIEKKLSFTRFVTIADSIKQRMMFSNGTRIENTFNKSLDTIVAKANTVLINSNLGFNNIDSYIHKGEVLDLYVQYNMPETKSKVKTDFTTTIIKGINTSINNFNHMEDETITSRYIKNRDFILLRLDPEGYMQTDYFTPKEISTNSVSLILNNKVYIKNKKSNEIAKLLGL